MSLNTYKWCECYKLINIESSRLLRTMSADFSNRTAVFKKQWIDQ
jgi:hypothetical protein